MHARRDAGGPVTAVEGTDGHGARPSSRWTRRGVLRLGLTGVATVVGLGAVGVELVDHGVLPGRSLLDRLDGACDVGGPAPRFGPLGASFSGHFSSHARRRVVGYTVAYPSGHGPGSRLPLVVMLHGFGGDHRTAAGMPPARALAASDGRGQVTPVAMVTVDGGNGYWHPHRGDDPMGMVVGELVPRLRVLGLGRPPHRIGAMGISMGGYGAILLAERYPRLFRAVAAISPAIWTTYDQAAAVNPGAYDSPSQFAAYDAVTHAGALARTPVRIASGDADPFHPGVAALAAALPKGATIVYSAGCHTGAFFVEQLAPSLSYLTEHLSS